MTIKPPLFSIITVTKNNLRGLNATFGSVKAQSCMDYEWIVVDGLSDDGTQELLPSLPALSSSEGDDGIYDAMNKGIERARGDYIIFMNAGDVFADPDILSTLSKAIRAEQPDFIYGDALENDGRYKKARGLQWIFYGMFTHHQAMLYKTALLKDLRYNTIYKIAADYDFTVRFIKRASELHYFPAAICIFELGGLSQQRMKLGRIEQFKVRQKLKTSLLITNIAVFIVQSFTSLKRQKKSLRP